MASVSDILQTEQVVGLLREDILLNKYQPADRLSEVQLATSYKVSRSPIREALQRLASEGLVKIVPRKGAFVATFKKEEIKEVFEIREAIDGIAARLAALRAGIIQIQRLVDTLQITKSVLVQEDIPSYPLDLDFHLKIIDAANNSRLRDLGYEIHSQIRLARSKSAYKSHRASIAYEEHSLILEKIKARDAVGAEEAMRSHIRNALASVIKMFD